MQKTAFLKEIFFNNTKLFEKKFKILHKKFQKQKKKEKEKKIKTAQVAFFVKNLM